MLKLTTLILLLCNPLSAFAGDVPCDLQPMPLPVERWERALETVLPPSKQPDASPQYPVRDLEFAFDTPRDAVWAGGLVVPLILRVTMDVNQLSERWERIARDKAEDHGCNHRKRWAKDFERSIQGSKDFQGLFRIQYDDWSCGKWPIINTWWYNKNFEVNATVRQQFMPRISSDKRNLEIGFTGSYDDNVPRALKDLATFFGNIVSVSNILGKDLTNLDENIFAQLDAHRKMIAEVERFRVLDSRRIGLLPVGSPQQPATWLDLTFEDARFAFEGGKLALHLVLRSAEGKEVLASQACALKQSLSEVMYQGDTIGPAGKEHEVAQGENLWSIAKSYYGDGAYFHLLAASNGIRPGSPLPVGARLAVEPLSKVLGSPGLTLVGKGDSLWRLSPGTAVFPAVVRANREDHPDPDLVYPFQMVKLPAASNGGS